MTHPTHPHLSDEQKAELDELIELQARIGDAHENYGRNDERTMHARQVFKASLSAALATPPAAAEAPAVRDALQALVDLRGHGSWAGKWVEAWDNAYAALAAHPKADSTEPKACATCGGRGVIARSFRDGDEYDACPECNTPSPVNPASAQAGERSDAELAQVFIDADVLCNRKQIGEISSAILALRPKAQPLTDTMLSLRKEAAELSSILAGMGEGGYNLETLYTDDQADGDAFVKRAADLLAILGIASPTKGEGNG